jgi:hypothetical protein
MTTTRGPQDGTQFRLRSYKLTSVFLRRIVSERPPERETIYADHDVPRHYIRVRPPTKPGALWPAESRVRYTLPGGHRRWLTVGNPRTMSLSALREAARAALAIVDAGGDPAAERSQRRDAWTVNRLWAAYQASSEFARCTPLTRKFLTSRFERHILPRIGNETLTAVDVPMARRLARAVQSDTRTNASGRRLRGPGAARKVVRILSGALPGRWVKAGSSAIRCGAAPSVSVATASVRR